MEVAEVNSSYPEMECILFPKDKPFAMWELFKHLRDILGKSAVLPEDEIRSHSIRTEATLRHAIQASGIAAESFLRAAEATISFSRESEMWDSRIYELVNKTNQFNLNGRRCSESEWLSLIQNPATLILSASYKDKFGTLGKIAVLVGQSIGSRLSMELWAVSCRAFSRRIEHQCLNYLFDKMGFDEIAFAYKETSRNGPIQSFFRELLGEPPAPNLLLHKVLFASRTPTLFHRVVDLTALDQNVPEALESSANGRYVSAT